jgi:hypothetical protein
MQDTLQAQGAQSTDKTCIAVGRDRPASPSWAISLTRTVSLISQKMRPCREVPGFAWVAKVYTNIVTTHSDRDVRPTYFRGLLRTSA